VGAIRHHRHLFALGGHIQLGFDVTCLPGHHRHLLAEAGEPHIRNGKGIVARRDPDEIEFSLAIGCGHNVSRLQPHSRAREYGAYPVDRPPADGSVPGLGPCHGFQNSIQHQQNQYL